MKDLYNLMDKNINKLKSIISMNDSKQKIINELYDTIQLLGGKSDILSIVGSCGDVMSDEDVLSEIKKYNEGLRKFYAGEVDGFTEAALPLIKYLCENHNPHVFVIVTHTNAELLGGIKSTGEILNFIKD